FLSRPRTPALFAFFSSSDYQLATQRTINSLSRPAHRPDRTNMRWREAAVGLRFGSLATSTPRAGVCLCLCVRARTGQENNESKGNQKDIKYGTYKISDAASNASNDL